MKKTPGIFCLYFMLIFSSPFASAKAISTLTVSENPENQLPTQYYGATKSAIADNNSPQIINQIQRQQIQLRHPNSINELLRYTAGISAEVRGSTSYMSEIYIRGFMQSNTESYDGLILPYNVTGNTKARIDPWLISRVEIIKGPVSSLYGNVSPGGLVNIHSKQPDGQRQTRIGFDTGSRHLKTGYLDSGGHIPESHWQYRLLAKATKTDEQQRTTRYADYLLAPSFRWQPDEKTRFTLESLLQNIPQLTPSSPMPLPYLRSHYASSRDFAGDQWNNFHQNQWMLGYSLEHLLDNGVQLKQKARYFNIASKQKNIYATDIHPAAPVYILNRFAYTTDEYLHSFNIDNQISKTLTIGRWKHHLLAGFDYQTLNAHFHYRYASHSPDINLRAANYQLVKENQLGLYDYQKNRLAFRQRGYYLQDQIIFNSLNITTSLRYDDYRALNTDYLNHNPPRAIKQFHSIKQSHLSKRLGALYRLDNGLAPFISYADGFLPVSPQGSMRDKDTRPILNQQWESGVKYLLADFATHITASVFRIRQKNIVVAFENASNPGHKDYRQIGEVESTGAELNIISRPSDNLTLIANYAYTHVINRKDHLWQGKRPIYIAENQFNLWVDYTFTENLFAGLTLGGGIRYIGPKEISKDNDQGKSGGTSQYDLAASYDLGAKNPALSGFTLHASAQNITNKITYSCYKENSCWIGPDRRVQLGISYQF